ncbi:helix-turn-helix domain-containing protein [Streptomyces sp. NPDC047043]|uniref:helix-turn-helix domain-containing protein n=1 Tax=Streptomyces sp. NPDC047043 TaxID=3154497 RepID=UPI0033FCF4AA
MPQEILRAFKFAVDPTPSQVEAFTRHAGAARWAFNHALGMKVAAHEQWRREVQAFVDLGMAEAEARKKVRVPTKPVIQKRLRSRATPGLGGFPEGVYGPERPSPWWHEVNTHAFQSAFIDADWAWKNWLGSVRGTRDGGRCVHGSGDRGSDPGRAPGECVAAAARERGGRGGTPNPVTGKPTVGRKYAPSTRAHCETVVRSF